MLALLATIILFAPFCFLFVWQAVTCIAEQNERARELDRREP